MFPFRFFRFGRRRRRLSAVPLRTMEALDCPPDAVRRSRSRPRLCLIETRCYVAAHARGHNFEFGAPVKRQLVQGVGTSSSERALRKTGVPRRSYSMSSSILFIFSEHAHGVVESVRSKGDDSNEAKSDVPIAVLDVNDTRPSDLLRGRRVL